MRSAILGVAAALALAGGCMTNVGTVKSTDARQPEATTGAQAQKEAPKLAAVQGGDAKGKHDDRLELVATYLDAQAAGVAVSQDGRIFLSFPRWVDPVKNTVVELKDGKLVPFPDEETNAFDGTKLKQYKPEEHLISVQAITFDSQNRLWIVDPGSFNFAPNILHGPKLWAYDINTGKRVKEISFPTDVATKMTYLNDVRFDLSRGAEGTAFLTDSGMGGIVVVDIATGKSWRHLDRDPSVMPTIGLVQQSEGKTMLMRKPTGEVDAPDLRSDGIALSPDGKTLYYTAVASRDIYSISTDLLADQDPDHESQVRAGVKKVATKPSGNDGLLCDSQGRIYSTDFEDGAIRRTDPKTGSVEIVVQDERLIWPDTLAMHGNQLYFTVNQLAREPMFHFGKDMRQPPYALFRMQVDATSKQER